MQTRFRWHAGALSVNNQTIVGCVDQGASGHWFAYGCMDDWQDTPLGSFDTKEEAEHAALNWAEEHL
jgi:hypothetical protein